MIFHNEAYSNSSSSPEASPGKFRSILKERSPSPKRGSSFISAVINAIKNATSQTPFSAHRDISKDTICTGTYIRGVIKKLGEYFFNE